MSYIGNSPGVASQRVETAFTATASQTVFTPSSGYTLGYCDVYYNGVKLVNGDDYTAADGVSITLATAAAAGDSVVVVASFPRGLSDGYLKAEADAKYVALTGDQTVAGVKTFSGSATIVNGNLGVGTSSVLGNSNVNALLGFVARNSGATTGYFQTYNSNAGTDLKTWRLGGDNAGNLIFQTVNDAYSSATSRLTLDASGRLGIGTTSPAVMLDVVRNQNALTALNVFNNDSTNASSVAAIRVGYDSTYHYSISRVGNSADIIHNATQSSANLIWQIGGTERARIDSSGRFFVGSGFSGITNTGSLTNPTIFASGSIEFNYDGVSGTQRHGRIMGNGTTGGGAYGGGIDLEYYAYDGSTYRWYTGARLDSSGNLLVGTTSSEAKLTVAGNIRMPWGANRSLTIGTSSNWGYVFSGESNELYIRDLDANFNFLHASYNSGTKFIEFAGTTLRVFSGSAQVNGSLSKSSGSFRIDHPIPEMSDTHHLVHSFVEAPQADNIYRGKATLVGGAATVNIDEIAGMTDGTFVLLNREVQCFTTNETGWVHVRGSVTGNVLTIEAQDNTCTDTISWMVIGERRDKHMYDTEWTDENGKVIVEPLKEVVPEPEQPVEEAA